jgi:hypothetical protein
VAEIRPSDDVEHLERLLAAEYPLLSFSTPDRDQVVNLFQLLDRARGLAVYLWSPVIGLRRLAVDHIPIPETQRACDALDYVLARKHYGIFVFPEFQGFLEQEATQRQLLAIANAAPRRVLVFIGNPVTIPEPLAPHTVQVSDAGAPPAPG